jgi:UDP-glucose 4-epimerase
VRLLITGGAGCLGSNLIEEHLAQGDEILIIDNFATGSREALTASPRLEIIDGTIADRRLVDAAFTRFAPTHVIHSAASYKEPNDWREDVATNITGTINTVEAARNVGVERFVYLQTALCYGRPERVPIPVEHPTRPFTSYGISKTAGEAYLAISDLPWVSLRLANITGPRLAIGPIPTFYKRLRCGQECFCSDAIRDFLDISDFLALMRIVLRDDAPIGIFNVSTGEGHTIAEVFNTIVACLGITLPERVRVVPAAADDIAAVVLDPSRTRAALGWRAEMGLSESIARMVRWYDTHGVPVIYSHLRPPPAEEA